MPSPAVPDHHRAAAILALRDGTLEVVVFDRMILDLHRQPLLAGDQAWSARDGPALHHTVELEPQVVVEAAGGVLLDDELVALAARLRAARLRCHVELAFAVVDLKTHDRLASHLRKTHQTACGDQEFRLTMRTIRAPHAVAPNCIKKSRPYVIPLSIFTIPENVVSKGKFPAHGTLPTGGTFVSWPSKGRISSPSQADRKRTQRLIPQLGAPVCTLTVSIC